MLYSTNPFNVLVEENDLPNTPIKEQKLFEALAKSFDEKCITTVFDAVRKNDLKYTSTNMISNNVFFYGLKELKSQQDVKLKLIEAIKLYDKNKEFKIKAVMTDGKQFLIIDEDLIQEYIDSKFYIHDVLFGIDFK